MKAEQQLVHDYWNSVYTGNFEIMDGKIADDFKGSFNVNGKEVKVTSGNEFMSLAKKSSDKIAEVTKEKREFIFHPNRVIVHFKQTLELTTGQEMTSGGSQDWTVKPDENGKLVLASLNVEEKASIY